MSTFKRNLFIGYGLSLLLLLTSALASYYSIRNLLTSSQLVNHTNEMIKKMDGALMAVKDGESGQRGYLLTNGNEFLLPYQGAYERAIANVDAVKGLIGANSALQAYDELLRPLVEWRRSSLDRV